MTDRSVPDTQSECEQAVAAAARREKAARSALNRGLTPSHPDWTPSDQDGYEARLAGWRAASHSLLEVLNEVSRLDARDAGESSGRELG
jgi:hypothetical protein